MWEEQVLEVWGKGSVNACHDQQEVDLERAIGALCSIVMVHVRWDKLKLGFPLEGDGFLISGAGFIVSVLCYWNGIRYTR